MSRFYLHQYTFIRLIVPWIAGVFCGDCFFDGSSSMRWSILCLLFFAALSIIFYFQKSHKLRWCFGASLFGLCFMGGWIGMTKQLNQSVYNFPPKELVYRVELTGNPEPKEKSYLCRVRVKEFRDSVTTSPVDRLAILYLENDSSVVHLKGGDNLLIATRISPPKNSGNFDEFDYARYLLRQGVSGTGYVSTEKWESLSTASAPSDMTLQHYRYIADSYRNKVLDIYRKLGFNGDELAVLSALTIGDKTELSESVRESFSVSGASHVLALSGLHIGLLYGMFFFLLKPLTERWRAGRCLRSLLLLLLLWTFAFFTGLSPSVVRSASMFSIVTLAGLFQRNPLSLNTLAATALLMLLCNPVWLFDVGFQLSFLAVAAILLIQPFIYRLFPVENRLGKYVWGLMSVSIAAQLGTAPLVLLYFFRFSTHFLLTNLVVIPLVSCILYLSVFMLLVTPLPWIQEKIVWMVDVLLKMLNGFTRWVEQLPYASLDNIWMYKAEVAGIYLLLILVGVYFKTHRAKYVLLCLSCLLLVSVYHSVMGWNDCPQRSIVFYNVRGCPSVHCIEPDGHSWLSYAENTVEKKRLLRVAGNFWKKHKLQPLELTHEYQGTDISVYQQIISFHNSRVCMVTDNRWQNKRTDSPLFIQYLYLCKGYSGSLKELCGLFHPAFVILDSSLSEFRIQAFQKECSQQGIPNVSLSEKGSMRFLL